MSILGQDACAILVRLEHSLSRHFVETEWTHSLKRNAGLLHVTVL